MRAMRPSSEPLRGLCDVCRPISDALPFGRLWYGDQNSVANAIGYAKHRSRSHDALIRVYDEAGNVIQEHEHAGEFEE